MFILRTNEGRQKGIETYNGIKFKILEKSSLLILQFNIDYFSFNCHYK